MSSSKKKIVLIRVWHSPPIAASVQKVLVESFPEYEVETIDIVDLLKKDKWVILVNTFHTMREYGRNILRGKNHFKVYFYGTTYLFHWVHAALVKTLQSRQDELAFIFQDQSMFDARLDGIPHFIYTDQTARAALDYPDADPDSLFSPAWIELEKSLCQKATMVFTRSHNIARSLVEQYGCVPGKVACVYVGANAKISSNELENDNYSNQNILFVGVDWDRKGGSSLVEAFERLSKVYPRSSLTIVGAKPHLNHPNIKVVGPVPVCQVQEYYKKASVFCLPTLAEPFGVVFVEALAQGLPIVGTNIGAIPDFIDDGKNGFLVPPRNVNRLVEALSELLDSPEKCRAFGERGRKLAETRYNWKSVGQALRDQILPFISH